MHLSLCRNRATPPPPPQMFVFPCGVPQNQAQNGTDTNKRTQIGFVPTSSSCLAAFFHLFSIPLSLKPQEKDHLYQLRQAQVSFLVVLVRWRFLVYLVLESSTRAIHLSPPNSDSPLEPLVFFSQQKHARALSANEQMPAPRFQSSAEAPNGSGRAHLLEGMGGCHFQEAGDFRGAAFGPGVLPPEGAADLRPDAGGGNWIGDMEASFVWLAPVNEIQQQKAGALQKADTHTHTHICKGDDNAAHEPQNTIRARGLTKIQLGTQ